MKTLISSSPVVFCEPDQIGEELIYSLANLPSFGIIRYVENGLYDRMVSNFKEFRKEPTLFENDKYDWYLIPSPGGGYLKQSVHSLARPGKEVVSKFYVEYPEVGPLIKSKSWSVFTNTVKIKRFIYRSANFPEVIGYTYGDYKGNQVIKPMKILTHSWKQERTLNDKYIWKCSECKLSGISFHGAKKAIIPNELLTCDEVLIKDIIE